MTFPPETILKQVQHRARDRLFDKGENIVDDAKHRLDFFPGVPSLVLSGGDFPNAGLSAILSVVGKHIINIDIF